MRWLVATGLLCLAGGAAANAEPICPDRPTKGTGTCTVAAGHLQVETALIDWTHDETGGVTSNYSVLGATLVKYGISGRADIELGIVPFETLKAKAEGFDQRLSGIGDMVARTKVRLTRDDSPMQIAIDPFVKIPTAKHDLGNGKVEAGLVMPFALALGGPFSIASAPEIDFRSDADGHEYHPATVQLIDFGIAATPRLSFTAELWGQWDWNPAATVKQYSADAAIGYLLNDNLQIDGGANFGLNRQTPDLEVYTGVSARF